jgi:hypothetical protein
MAQPTTYKTPPLTHRGSGGGGLIPHDDGLAGTLTCLALVPFVTGTAIFFLRRKPFYFQGLRGGPHIMW